MKTKITLTIFISLFLLSFVASVGIAYAASECSNICFRPNVPIPGMSIIFGDPDCGGGGPAGVAPGYRICPDSIGKYVSALYTYGARLAAVVALFMIVLASWQWMLASGNASKIDTAKDTIRGALVGLALLFAGQILLNAISEKFVSFEGLNIDDIDSKYLSSEYEVQCRSWSSQLDDDGKPMHCQTTKDIFEGDNHVATCFGQRCDDVDGKKYVCVKVIGGNYEDATGENCPIVGPPSGTRNLSCGCTIATNCVAATNGKCDNYTNEGECNDNICYHSTIRQGCVWEDDNDRCIEIKGSSCESSAECIPDLLREDGQSLYCCNRYVGGSYGGGRPVYSCQLRSKSEGDPDHHTCLP